MLASKRVFSTTIPRLNSLYETVVAESRIRDDKTVILDTQLHGARSNVISMETAGDRKHLVFTTGNFDTSPWKCAVVAHMLKGMSYTQALTQLQNSKKKPARILAQTFIRAGNAIEQNTLITNPTRDPTRAPTLRTQLEVVRTFIGKGQYGKMHARGKMGRMHHPTAHIKVEFRVVPIGISIGTRSDGVRLRTDFEKIWDRLRRNRLIRSE